MKQFKCKWGDWELGEHSYDPKETTENSDFFSTDIGYEPSDITAIDSLKVGETHSCIFGNHTVTRIQ